MIGIHHNVDQLPPRYRQAVRGWDEALLRGLRRIGAKVQAAATANLSGGGEPGSYPVPRRTGTLARGGGFKTAPRSVAVGWIARNPRRGADHGDYAMAVHEGFRPYGNRHAPRYPGRPFLLDAASSVDAVGEIGAELDEVLP